MGSRASASTLVRQGHVDAIQGGLGVDGGLVAVVFEPGVGDREVEVLAHLELSADLADCDADLIGAGQGSLADALGDVGQFLLGRLQEVLAFAGAFGGQRRVAAGDQPFAGVVGVGDLGEVLLVEQAHLQRPVVAGQFRDRRGTQRGDPIEKRCGAGFVVEFAELVDAGAGDHAAVADQHQPLDAELVLDHLHDLGERARVVGVAREHPYCDRAAVGVGEHAVFDLLAALLAVAGVAACGQLAAPPGHPRGSQVEQRHPARVHRLR